MNRAPRLLFTRFKCPSVGTVAMASPGEQRHRSGAGVPEAHVRLSRMVQRRHIAVRVRSIRQFACAGTPDDVVCRTIASARTEAALEASYGRQVMALERHRSPGDRIDKKFAKMYKHVRAFALIAPAALVWTQLAKSGPRVRSAQCKPPNRKYVFSIYEFIMVQCMMDRGSVP